MTAHGGDLLAWLETVITVRENVFRQAIPGPWAAHVDDDEVVAADGVTVADVFALSGGQLRATARHITANDPESVLRRYAADRKELARHTPTEWPTQTPAVCPSCARWDHETAMGDAASAMPFPFPCPSVRALALGYGWTEGER